MPEKISMDILLPVALELYKLTPGRSLQIKSTNQEERIQNLTAQADDFATFYHCLHQKLEGEKSL